MSRIAVASMLIVGVAVPKPPPGGYDRADPPEPVCFAFSPPLPDGASIQAHNLARRFVNAVTAFGEGDILEGWPPEDEYLHLWHVTITTTARGARRLDVGVDYQRLPGCSNEGARQMMEVYRAVRRAAKS